MKDIKIIRQLTKEAEQLSTFQARLEGFIDQKIHEASENGEWEVHINLKLWAEEDDREELQLSEDMVETIANKYEKEGYMIKDTMVNDLHIAWDEI